ncbi:MAG: signal peptidase I [Clostridia bacterium]|nr:signal peptidase I [Clostridia bacterium]
MANKSKKARLRRKRARRIFLTLLILLSLAAVFIRVIAFETHYFFSDAMKPAYRKGDLAVMEKYEMLTENEVERGDIVLAKFESASVRLVRRVFGMPGDLIDVRGEEKFLVYKDESGVMREKMLGNAPGLVYGTLPENAFLLLNDNPEAQADDSRTLGLVYLTDITAEAGMILWPPSRMFRNE